MTKSHLYPLHHQLRGSYPQLGSFLLTLHEIEHVIVESLPFLKESHCTMVLKNSIQLFSLHNSLFA